MKLTGLVAAAAYLFASASAVDENISIADLNLCTSIFNTPGSVLAKVAGTGGATYARLKGRPTTLGGITVPSALVVKVNVPYPASALEGDKVTLSVKLRVSNPLETFDGTITAPVTAIAGDLCRLIVSTIQPPSLLTLKPQFNDLLQPVNDRTILNNPDDLIVPANPAGKTVEVQFSMACLSKLADFEIQLLQLEVPLVVPPPTTTSETSTSETSTTSDETTTTSDETTTTSDETTTTTTTTEDDDSSTTTTTTGPSITPLSDFPVNPRQISTFLLEGCYSSPSRFPSFQLQASEDNMDLNRCVALCRGRGFSATYDRDCYCGEEMRPRDFVLLPRERCNIRCPGNNRQLCGGPAILEDRSLQVRQSPPISIFLVIYINIRVDGSSTTITAPGTTVTAPGTTITGPASTVTAPATTHTFTTSITPYPPRGWWSCIWGVCGWDLTILKPWTCDWGCDGETYYELICDKCKVGEEIWKPIKCFNGSCRGKKNLCKIEKCHGGNCGDWPVVEKKVCTECDGGFSYCHKPKDSPGKWGKNQHGGWEKECYKDGSCHKEEEYCKGDHCKIKGHEEEYCKDGKCDKDSNKGHKEDDYCKDGSCYKDGGKDKNDKVIVDDKCEKEGGCHVTVSGSHSSAADIMSLVMSFIPFFVVYAL